MESKACKIYNSTEDIRLVLREFTQKLLEEPKKADAFFVKAKIYTPTGKLNIKYR